MKQYMVRYADGDLRERVHRWTGTYRSREEALDAISRAPEEVRVLLRVEERES